MADDDYLNRSLFGDEASWIEINFLDPNNPRHKREIEEWLEWKRKQPPRRPRNASPRPSSDPDAGVFVMGPNGPEPVLGNRKPVKPAPSETIMPDTWLEDDDERLGSAQKPSAPIKPAPLPDLKPGEEVCSYSVSEEYLDSERWIKASLILLATGFVLSLLMVAATFGEVPANRPAAWTLIGFFLAIATVGLWFTRESLLVSAVKRKVRNVSCTHCGHFHQAVGMFDCECGKKIRVERHVADPCPLCDEPASHLRCAWCGQDVEIWGSLDNYGYKCPYHRISVTKSSAKHWPN